MWTSYAMTSSGTREFIKLTRAVRARQKKIHVRVSLIAIDTGQELTQPNSRDVIANLDVEMSDLPNLDGARLVVS
jgi:hypothetical protein